MVRCVAGLCKVGDRVFQPSRAQRGDGARASGIVIYRQVIPGDGAWESGQILLLTLSLNASPKQQISALCLCLFTKVFQLSGSTGFFQHDTTTELPFF